MLRVAIIGASGYSGEELVRLLLRHPRVQIVSITSRQNAGKKLGEVFPRFSSCPSARRLRFTHPNVHQLLSSLRAPLFSQSESVRNKTSPKKKLHSAVAFLALPHGVASEWALPLIKQGVRVIDLSADFRLRDPSVYREYYEHPHPAPQLLSQAIYGLPEIHRAAIKKGRLIASPGCYPTSILLPLIPLLRAGLIKPHGIIADSLSGVSGAGRKIEESYLYCECNESARPYAVPKHRHLSEIEQELALAAGRRVVIQFTPHLIPVTRGILTTIYVRPEEKLKNLSSAVTNCYHRAYSREPFMRLLNESTLPDLKNVVNTNFIEIAHRVDPRTGRLILFSAEDNLTKGAAGQAVQSMNILFGFPETHSLL